MIYDRLADGQDEIKVCFPLWQRTVEWLGSVVLTPFSVQETTMQHLELFAADGLRTLCLAVKELDRDTYDEWNAKYNQAALQISGREAAVPTYYLARWLPRVSQLTLRPMIFARSRLTPSRRRSRRT